MQYGTVVNGNEETWVNTRIRPSYFRDIVPTYLERKLLVPAYSITIKDMNSPTALRDSWGKKKVHFDSLNSNFSHFLREGEEMHHHNSRKHLNRKVHTNII